jgi:hypothetical protein
LPKNSTPFADSEVDQRQAIRVGCGLHGPTLTFDFAIETLGKTLEVILKVGQEDVIAKLVQGHAGVTRQPIAGNLETFLHAGPVMAIPVMPDCTRRTRKRRGRGSRQDHASSRASNFEF